MKKITKKIWIPIFVTFVLLCLILLFALRGCISCAGGHSWGEWTVTREATCSETGSRTHTCSVCHKTETEKIPTLEHKFQTVWDSGETRHWQECIVCSYKGNAEYHTPGEWKVLSEPTCETSGYKKRSCTVCDKEEIMAIPSTGHTYSDSWSANSINHYHKCTVCSGKTEAEAHCYETWVTVREATYQSEGMRESVCTVCGHKCSATIARLGAESVAISGGNGLTVGSTLQLSAALTPDTLADKTVTWSSSDEKVATVSSDGMVTGLSLGNTVITAAAANGKKAAVSVWVTETAIDGTLGDRLYAELAPFIWNQTEYNIGENIRLYLGIDGLYIADQVMDAGAKGNGDKSHIESFLTLSDEFSGSDSIGLRFYPNGYSATGSIYRTYEYDYKGSSETYRWSERKGTDILDMCAAVQYTETGYNIEAFIPWSTLGKDEAPDSIRYMSVVTAMYGSQQKMRYGTYQDDVISYKQIHAYDTANYIEYDSKGFVHKEVGIDNETIVLNNADLTDQNYTAEFTLHKLNSLNPLTCATFKGTGAEYITEVGGGVYRIRIPYAKRKDFAVEQSITIADGRNLGRTFTLQVIDAKMVRDLAVTYDGGTAAPVLYRAGDTLDMTKFAARTAEDATLDYQWSMTYNDSVVMKPDMDTGYAFSKIGTYVLTAEIISEGYIGSADMTIYVLDPAIYVNYNGGIVVNSGSDIEAVVGTYKLNAENNATAFEAVENTAVTYTTGIGGDEKGAIVTNHRRGAYTVVKDYSFGTDDFSVSVWFHMPEGENISKGSATYLFGVAEPDRTDSGFAVSLKADRLRIKLLGTMYDPEISYEQGAWYNITLCREGNAVKVYFDGELLATYKIDTFSNFGTVDLSFGGYINRAEKYQDNKMYFDNVQVYDTALAAEQIRAISLTDSIAADNVGISPKVYIDFAGGTAENSGTDRTVTAGAYVMDAMKNATKFEPAADVSYTTGIDGDENGALITNHYKGPYTVVKDYVLGTDDFTISSWFNVPKDAEVSTGSSTYVMGIDHPDTKTKFAVSLKSRELRFRLEGATKSIPISYEKDTWYNLTICREGTNMKIYFDGSLVGTYTVSENCDFGTSDIAFGAYYGVSYAYKNANMYYDEIKIYGASLTQEQISLITAAYKE